MMTKLIPEVEAHALKLSAEQRTGLIDRLLASLPIDPVHDEAWGLAAERRLAEMESGTVAPVPVADAIARACCTIE